MPKRYETGGIAPKPIEEDNSFGAKLSDFGRFAARGILGGVGAENLVDPDYNTKAFRSADNTMSKYVRPVEQMIGGAAADFFVPGLGTAINSSKNAIRGGVGSPMDHGQNSGENDYEYQQRMAGHGYDVNDHNQGWQGLNSVNLGAITGGLPGAGGKPPVPQARYGGQYLNGGIPDEAVYNYNRHMMQGYAQGGIVDKGDGVKQFYGATHEQGGVPFYAGEAEGGGITPQGKPLPGEVMLKRQDGSDYILSNERNIAKDFERNRKSIENGNNNNSAQSKALDMLKNKYISKNDQLLADKNAESSAKAQQAYGRFMKKHGGAITPQFWAGGGTEGQEIQLPTKGHNWQDPFGLGNPNASLQAPTVPNQMQITNTPAQQTPQNLQARQGTDWGGLANKVIPYAGDAFQIAQTLGPQHYVPKASNGERGNINKLMGNRSINMDPYIQDIRAQYNDTADRIGKNTNNQAQYIDAMLSANTSSNRATSEARLNADQANNGYRGDEAGMRERLGAEEAQYQNNYNIGKNMTDANAQNIRAGRLSNMTQTYDNRDQADTRNKYMMDALGKMSPEDRDFYYNKITTHKSNKK